jgi:hypothetical protein
VADDELHDAFTGLIDELVDTERRLREAQPPLDERERVESYRWIFSVLQVALDAYVWADTGRPRFVDIVGPNKKWGGDNTDAFYKHAPIDPQRTYMVRCTPGDAVYLSLTVYGGPSDGHYSERIVASANDRTIERNSDGSFELVLSTEPHPGNWLELERDAVCAITRDYVRDPASARRAEWTIAAVDPPVDKDDSVTTVAAKFRAARVFLDEQARISPVRVDPPNEVQEPYPVPSTTFGWAAGDAAYAMGSFQLAENEALVIDGRSPDPAHLRRRVRTGHDQRFAGRAERRRLVAHRRRVQGSWASELDQHAGPRARSALVPVVPSVRDAGAAALRGGICEPRCYELRVVGGGLWGTAHPKKIWC